MKPYPYVIGETAMKIDINQRATIILRKRGIKAISKYYKDLHLEPPCKYHVGDQYEASLWEIMNIFGSSCFMGPEPPFDPQIILREWT